jgi:hypothetical protein
MGERYISGFKRGYGTVRVPGEKFMPDFVWVIIIFAAYIVLIRWVLPAFGVQT